MVKVDFYITEEEDKKGYNQQEISCFVRIVPRIGDEVVIPVENQKND